MELKSFRRVDSRGNYDVGRDVPRRDRNTNFDSNSGQLVRGFVRQILDGQYTSEIVGWTQLDAIRRSLYSSRANQLRPISINVSSPFSFYILPETVLSPDEGE